MNFDNSSETVAPEQRLQKQAMNNASSFSVPPTPPAMNSNEESTQELTRGLLADRAFISSKYFYNTLGSLLFEAISVLPEYYPTRTEAQLIERIQRAISDMIPKGSTLIDLGAGNCAKAARLFPLIHPKQYVPVDISTDHLNEAVRLLQPRFSHITMTALGRDLSTDWCLPDEVRQEQRLFFYPGSSIGNFQPDAALAFLKHCRSLCRDDGGILIGIDLVKEPAILNAAYNDSLGVTSAFNLNILHHVNHLLGSDFDIRQWQHHAFFNVEKSRIEMHLEAKAELDISWHHHRRHFLRGERIHTENSYKYSLPSFLGMLVNAGFGKSQQWTDDNNGYALIYATAS